MRIYFGGAENPGHRKHLYEWGARAMSVNFKHLIPRLPKTKPWLVEERFSDDVRVSVHFEVPDESPELADVYWEWVETNTDRLDFAVEPSGAISIGVLERWRADSPAIPMWHPDDGHRALQRLVESYSGLAVPQRAWASDKPVTARLNRLVTGDGTHVHGLGVSKWDILSTVAFGSVSTGSWMSAQKYGETQVWDGSELRRFPANDKDARQRYRAHIARSGLDVEAIEADDKDEVCKLAVWSWQQVEESLSRRREVNADVEIGRIVSDTTPEQLDGDNAEPEEARPTTTSVTRATKGTRTRPTTPIPVMVFGHNEAADVTFEISHQTKRVCDNCQLDRVCPEYDPGASCAYEIPVQIRTKDQLISMLNGVIEMQVQRVAFARLREDLEGSIDRVVSDELDRLMSLTEKYKDITDNAETFKMQIEAKGQTGVLSRLFGSRVGQAAMALPGGGFNEAETEQFLRSAVSPIIDVPDTTTRLDP